jgi:hypothetical protein
VTEAAVEIGEAKKRGRAPDCFGRNHVEGVELSYLTKELAT